MKKQIEEADIAIKTYKKKFEDETQETRGVQKEITARVCIFLNHLIPKGNIHRTIVQQKT